MEKKFEIPLWLAERLLVEMKAKNKEEYAVFLNLDIEVHKYQESKEQEA